jgi:hypothetical protein
MAPSGPPLPDSPAACDRDSSCLDLLEQLLQARCGLHAALQTNDLACRLRLETRFAGLLACTVKG